MDKPVNQLPTKESLKDEDRLVQHGERRGTYYTLRDAYSYGQLWAVMSGYGLS